MNATKRVALIFGTCTGKTEEISEVMTEAFLPELEVEMVDVTSTQPDDLKKYEFVICGIPTWDVGELEYGWQDVYDELNGVDLSGVMVAIFGLGDQLNYSDTYQDAMGILYEKLLECGASGKIGFTSTEGHEFDQSRGLINDQFCGLALDEDNQDDLSEERIQKWTVQVKAELQQIKPDLLTSVHPNRLSDSQAG